MIISFLNQKGGTGKTTLAIGVASTIARSGHKVLLIDADKQGSATTWASLREEQAFPVIGLARPNMAKEAMKLAADYTHTVIDGPPHAADVARSCIAASDVVAIPIEPSGLSAWASDLTVKQATEALTFKETLKCAFVVSRKIRGTVIGREARTMVEGFPVLATEIEQRVGHSEALTMGRSIHEWAPGSLAARQIDALTTELLEMV